MFPFNPSATRVSDDPRLASCRPFPQRTRSPQPQCLSNRSTFATRASNRTICFHQLTQSLAQEKTPNHLLSIHCTLFRTRRNEQLVTAQRLTHSLVRSCAQEQKSTPSFSIACARFREKCRGASKFVLVLDCQAFGLFPESGRLQ
jgi:hypothetical protein